MKEKGTDLHDAVIVGDTVGDPFKDTSSVSLNPIIKFSTLFGLLAVEIAIKMKIAATDGFDYTMIIGGVFLDRIDFCLEIFYKQESVAQLMNKNIFGFVKKAPLSVRTFFIIA